MTELRVTHVDTSRDTPSREGNDLKGGKIRLSEDIDFEIGTPRQILDQLRGIINQFFVFGAHLLVNNSDETCTVVVISSGTVGGACTCLPTRRGRHTDPHSFWGVGQGSLAECI